MSSINVSLTNPAPISAVVSGATGPQGPVGPQGPAGAVLVASVNGQTGTVVLTSSSVSAASAVHGHVVSDVSGLQALLDGKADVASTNVPRVVSLNGITGTLTIAAGANVTVSTSASSITIAAGGGGGGGDVASVNGQTGTVTLTSSSVSAASAVHMHVVADITGFDAAAAAAAPVQSVAGRTGVITLTAADVGGLAAVATSGSYTSLSNIPTTFTPASHTHAASEVTSGTFDVARIPTLSYTSLANVPTTFTPAAHTHATSDITGFAAAAAAAAPVASVNGATGTVVLTSASVSAASAVHSHVIADITDLAYPVASVNGKTGTVTLTTADLTAAAATHTHSASDVTSGTFDIARIPTIGYTALSGVPTTFAPAAHTHDASAIASGTIDAARLPANVVTSVSLTASANNYALPAADIVRFSQSSTSNFDITGFATAATGEARLLLNVSTHTAATITLKHADTASTAVSQILVPWQNDCVLDPNGGSAVVLYDGDDSRWRVT